MPIVRFLMGICLLCYGRTLYWVFVAVAGFLVGVELGTQLLAQQAEWVRILAAIICGVLGGILGMFAQRIAFAIGGLFAGAYLSLLLARNLNAPGEPMIWFIIGGIIGAVVAAVVMDWAIIVLSSLAGAAAIVGAFDMSQSTAVLLLCVLSAIGIIVQRRRMLYVPPGSQPPV